MYLKVHQDMLSINFGSELGLLFDLFGDASTFVFVNASGHLAVHKGISFAFVNASMQLVVVHQAKHLAVHKGIW